MAQEHVIIRFISKKLIPFIQLYGLYVIMHGESGPGGGFQGGVILGSGLILYGIVFGLGEARKILSQKAGDIFCSLGVLLYAGIGLLALLLGGRYLEYRALPLGDPQMASQLAILGVEIGVGITVAAAMVVLFFEMARRRS